MASTPRKKVLTLVFLRKEGKVLLGLKKRGFGTGKWNGFGGKVEAGETIEEAAVREVREECGHEVDKEDLDKVAVIDFEFEGDPVILEVHVFKTRKFSGEMRESEEMRPQWYPEDGVPYGDMWADDEHWYPLLLKDKRFKAFFLFRGHGLILEKKIVEVDSL